MLLSLAHKHKHKHKKNEHVCFSCAYVYAYAEVSSFFCLCLCLCRGCSHLLMLMLCLCLCLCLCASENQPLVTNDPSIAHLHFQDVQNCNPKGISFFLFFLRHRSIDLDDSFYPLTLLGVVEQKSELASITYDCLNVGYK